MTERHPSVHMARRAWPAALLPHIAVRAALGAPRPPRRIGPLLALGFFALYALTAVGTFTTRDGGVMYDTAMAIVNRHTLALPPHHHGLPGVDGGFYSKYGIAQSLAEIPPFILGQIVAHGATLALGQAIPLALAMLTNAIITALAVWLFFLLAYELWPDARAAACAAVLVGVASPYWPYAKTDFSEPLSTLSITGAVLFLLRARTRPALRNYVYAGAFLALAMLTKLTAAFALPALALYALYVAVATGQRQGPLVLRRLLAWGIPVAVGLGLDALYNLARYGRLADTGYHADDLPFHAPLGIGLQGLLLSSGKGLLWYCPLLLLAVVLWPRFLARRRAEALLALGIVAPSLVVYGTYPVWWGGICWGPRYLVPLLPLLLMPLAFLLPLVPQVGLRRRAILTVITLSIAVQVVGVAVHPARFPATGISDAAYLWTAQDSPLLGHAWLTAYDGLNLVDPKAARALLTNYPWRHLAHSPSPGQFIAIAAWPYWWWQILSRQGLDGRILAGAAAVLALLLALAAWGLRRLRDPQAASPFDHQHMAVHA